MGENFLKLGELEFTTVKAIAETMADGSAPGKRRLFVIQAKDRLSVEMGKKLKADLKTYEDKFGIEFLVLGIELVTVQPERPAFSDITIHSDGGFPRQLDAFGVVFDPAKLAKGKHSTL